jgi:hypothetical protein
MDDRKESNEAPKRKMSEMISEIGAGFISVGKSLEERHNRLTAVCSAWNMACVSPENRQKQLQQFAASYRLFNPAISTDDLVRIVKDMETLINRKLTLFPDDHRQIVNSRVVPVGKDFRIEVVSVTVQ